MTYDKTKPSYFLSDDDSKNNIMVKEKTSGQSEISIEGKNWVSGIVTFLPRFKIGEVVGINNGSSTIGKITNIKIIKSEDDSLERGFYAYLVYEIDHDLMIDESAIIALYTKVEL